VLILKKPLGNAEKENVEAVATCILEVKPTAPRLSLLHSLMKNQTLNLQELKNTKQKYYTPELLLQVQT